MVQWAAFSPASDSAYANKFDEFTHLKPSEMGDTLAGVFAALAFIWIIVTVFLQSYELREQRKEFREQRRATEDMARSMAAQADIFEKEQRQREQIEADNQIHSSLEEIEGVLRRKIHFKLRWSTSETEEPDPWNEVVCDYLTAYPGNDASFDDLLYQRFDNLQKSMSNVTENLNRKSYRAKPQSSSALLELVQICEGVGVLSEQASEGMRSRLRKIGMQEFSEALSKFLARDDLWSDVTQ
ncbi:hypothetical protein [Lentibacter sp. XHP0401]|uniref:hypothetical protein n=1 Tax=Lentibacter sp. XHP0401 TaxID=2984334 RepID=UPI0021E772C0|nr:hypothetical protein [Lentibacter sp. XHP0401]MCV2893624.1 hypothetical protein [Lentibacter sp. XHP0401]